MLKACTILF